MKQARVRNSSVKLKKNDTVLVVAGKDRGTTGKVMRVFPIDGRAVVERVNMVKKHTRPNPQRQVQGGVLERESPISIANLRVICPECGAAARLGRRRLEDGRAARFCKKCNGDLA